ncbi:MAG: orotidine-5'-phosphate decarboxylase [Candidatus Lokiarchaeota archaeon]|nr:orotidine-5'-phosphate decarboxylase [Candidatus Lokiarchaeota archaeon]MBD3202306.1 orotidine-5'-phosphate decarboxylase [Candidatus Lokiarchaeota archaeon]
MSFIQKLIDSIRDKKSVVCMGLDPRMEQTGQIPQFIIDQNSNPNEIIKEFNKTLIENTYDLIPIIKPQIAFYEKYDALDALKETIKYAHKKDLLVLLDSKRNDIGSTSKAYAEANYGIYGADACTINAYFGIDGVKPFLDYKKRGTFILVKTSNPSSRDFQDLISTDLDPSLMKNRFFKEIKFNELKGIDNRVTLKPNYIKMTELVQKWAKGLEKYEEYHNLGMVVGATFPEELKWIRKLVSESFILIPGYGAQGATAEDIKFGFNKNGLGAIVNSSRGIMFAYNSNNNFTSERFAEAARNEIQKMNKVINNIIRL